MSRPAVPAVLAPIRAIGLGGVLLVATNGMIGTGIFALPGKLDAAVGMFAPLLLALAGLGFICIALSFADCARHFDRSGGQVLYVGTAFGRFPGFLTGWLSYVARSSSQAANANVLAVTAAALFPLAASSAGRAVLIILLIGVLTALNVIGVRKALAAIAGATLLKLAPLLILAVAALATFGPGPAPVVPPLADAASIALVALYAFTGFESGATAAGETRDPKHVLPRALVGTVIAVGLLYVLVQWAYSASAPTPSETPLLDLATRLGGPLAGYALALTVLVSVIGNLGASMLGSPRLTVGMAEEAMLPPRFAAVSQRFGTPAFSILFFGGVTLLLALSGSFVFLAVVSTLARLFSYFGCILAAPRLDRMFAAPRAWPRRLLFPAIAAALCIWAASQSRASEWQGLALLAAAGTALYLFAARKPQWLKPSPPPTA